MGLFWSDKPKRVTQEEMREIMQNLYGKLEKDELIEVEKLFRSDLNESGLEAGVSREEYESAIQWLKLNKKKHALEDEDISLVEKYFEQHLKD